MRPCENGVAYLDTVDDLQAEGIVEKANVPGVQPTLLVNRLSGLLGVYHRPISE